MIVPIDSLSKEVIVKFTYSGLNAGSKSSGSSSTSGSTGAGGT